MLSQACEETGDLLGELGCCLLMCPRVKWHVPWSKLLVLGMVIQPLIGNPYNGYMNPFYWVDDHPLLHGNNWSLDPGTHDTCYFKVLTWTTPYEVQYAPKSLPCLHSLSIETPGCCDVAIWGDRVLSGDLLTMGFLTTYIHPGMIPSYNRITINHL